MPPLVIDLMVGWRAELLRGDEALQGEMARRWLGVEQALQAQVDALALELQGSGRVTLGQLARSRRYRSLMEQVDDELGKYARFVEGRVVDRQGALLRAGIGHSQAAIAAVATEAQMTVQFNRLPSAAVEYMVGLTGAGTPVGAVLADAAAVGPDGLRQALVDGIALGRNPLETARRALRQGLGRSFTRMATIARTETLRVYRQTTLEGYRQSNVVVGYRRLCAKDERTCLGCLMADGRFYERDVAFEEHPAGRCAAVPVLERGSPIDFETGQEWFVRQPESVQREMLGPGRWALYERGEVTLNDLVTRRWDETWGGSLSPTPVGRLAALGRRAGAMDARNMLGVSAEARRVQWEWAHGSSRRTSVVLKETLQRSLGVEGVVFNPKGFVVSDDEVRAMEATVRAMYERTQVHLRKRGIDSVHLYRGIQSEIIEQGVVESWTGDVDTAVRFDGFLVLEEDVPAERIFLYYLGPGWRNGRFGEQFEYLVLKSVPKGDPR
jgi:SPP1 gp7 family putative phage head morphogenesis protein